jgi:protein-L-isoaspartate O-methyltransferase
LRTEPTLAGPLRAGGVGSRNTPDRGVSGSTSRSAEWAPNVRVEAAMDAAIELSPAAHMWGQPGAAYDGISFGLSDTISHAVQLLWPRPGEQVLDIGTGAGWAARLAARRGARVTTSLRAC